jgi:hypothetical protein
MRDTQSSDDTWNETATAYSAYAAPHATNHADSAEQRRHPRGHPDRDTSDADTEVPRPITSDESERDRLFTALGLFA